MGFNGDGTFSFPYNWVNDAANGIPITASRMDTQFNTAATGFDNCVTRDGQSPATANIPMGGFKVTGLGSPSNAGDAVAYGAVANLGATTFTGAITYGGVTLSNSVTGTGSMVLSAGPVITGSTTLTGAVSFTAAGNTRAIAVAPASAQTGYIDMRATNNGGELLWGVENSAGGGLVVGSQAYSGLIGTTGSLPLHLFSADTVRCTVASDGSFLINTTTPGGWSNNAKFACENAAAGYAISAYAKSSSTDAALVRVDSTSSLLTSYRFGSTQVGSVSTNGTTTTYGTSSDERLKNKLDQQRDHRSIIKSIWVGDVEYKADPGKAILAVMAQQALQHYPEAIQVPRDPEQEMYGADYSRFAPLALWGVQDLYALIDTLISRIEALENK